jgi:SOS response regulatory protein OraA/RecX
MAMGVERGIVDRAVAAHVRASEGSALPLALASKRAAQLRDLPRQVKRRRVLAYLARRGYSGRDIAELVGRVVG